MTNMLVGVISDTHGLLRPEVFSAFKKAELILHGGDIGSQTILDGLRTIAPVIAVRGNNEVGEWAEGIPETKDAKVGRRRIYLIHNLKEIPIDPKRQGFHIVISGHSHRPVIEERDGVMFINPGSAGPRRFKLPVTDARLNMSGANVSANLVDLTRMKTS